MILLQLSSAQGPEECCLAVKKALDRLIKEAARQDVAVTVLETETGRYSDTLRSALVSLDGDNAWALSESWCGTCNQVNHLIPTRVLVKGGEITCKILK